MNISEKNKKEALLLKEGIEEEYKRYKKNVVKRVLINKLVPILSIATFTFSFLLMYDDPYKYSSFFEILLDKKVVIILSILLAVIGTAQVFISEYRREIQNKPVDFIDIEKNKGTNSSTSMWLNALKQATTGVDKKDFLPHEYFNKMILFFDDRVSKTNKSALYLLDTGKKYSMWGIIFYIISICAWQIIIYFTGFCTQHIYGIAGCSIIFIFVQFLSAWFLKQYRYAVDTNTYLIKIKTILEKYYLTFLIIKEEHSNSKDYSKVVSMLSEEIKWPDTYLTKIPDVSFAKECMEIATQLVRAARSECQSEAKKEAKGE